MAKRIKIGDIIEIKTSKGLVYAQYTHKKEQWGVLLRILPGFYSVRPDDFSVMIKQKERFVIFFPLQAAVNRGIFEVAAHEEIPEQARPFPLFRAAGFRDREGRVHDWWLWDGKGKWRVKSLNEKQRKLPIRAVWNDTLLVQRIEEEWTPETDPLG